MHILHSILIARHKAISSGYLFVMKATAEMDLFIMAYAWSAKDVAYMLSSCGTIVMDKDLYIFRFEDDYGNVQEKQLPWLIVTHFTTV